MGSRAGAGRRVPLLSLAAVGLVVLFLPGSVLGAEWSDPKRVSSQRGARLDSLHQLASGGGKLHLLHPRIGPNKTDDRVVYQRSSSSGAGWSKERTLFSSSTRFRKVVPNMAIAANRSIVVVAWRVLGPNDATLFVRTSRDGGDTFGPRRNIFSTKRSIGIGVPAVAVGDGVIAVAWTNRGNGRIKVRTSRDAGRSFRKARTVGRTRLSIDCKRRVTDGLVGLAAAKRRIHLAWSYAPKRSCQASRIKMRTSADRGKTWNRQRTITNRRSYGWPELDARGSTVVATVQSPSGGLIVARSGQNGRNWSDRIIKPRQGYSLSAGDIVLLPRKKAMITYVVERIRRAKLLRTRVVSRMSRNDGVKYRAAKRVTTSSKRLRMAPNIAAARSRLVILFQRGPLDASRRNLFTTRLQ
ncbi:MAG: sialidase family protein [Chloroflexota bacterium]